MEKNRKCVMVMDASLAPGIAANTAALLGMTLGSKVKEAMAVMFRMRMEIYIWAFCKYRFRF